MDEEQIQKLRELTRTWPHLIRLKDVVKAYRNLGSGMFNDFLKEFQRATGYLQRGAKLTKEFDFEDQSLRQIAFELLEYPVHKASDGSPVIEISARPFVDYRAILTIVLLECMFWSHPLLTRNLDEDGLNRIGLKIIQRIPFTPRWVNPRLEGIYDKFESQRYDELSDQDFQFLNLAELRQIGMLAWYASWSRSRKKVDRIFRPFLIRLGISSIADYVKANLLPHGIVKDPEEASKREFRRGDIELYASKVGINPRSLMFFKDDIWTIRLDTLDQSFIPMFYEREKDVFRIEPRLHDVNELGGLCFSLARARSQIIDAAFKGAVFEDILFDILTGKIGIEYMESKWYAYSYAFVDVTADHKRPNVLRYGYRPIQRFDSPRIPI